MSNKLTPPISSPTDSQSWLLWHKDLGAHLANTTTVKSKAVAGTNDKLNYNINGSMMSIQYYGPASTDTNMIEVSLPVQCLNRSVITMHYDTAPSVNIVIGAGARTFMIPINTTTEKLVHIQGQVFIVT